jgi:hypothetical protein
MELELNKLKEESKKNSDRIIELNKILIEAVNILKRDSNIFKMSSSDKNVNISNYLPRDLINFTLRINKNYSSPLGLSSNLPGAYCFAYPLEDYDMKSSFLKFNFDESFRLKMPNVKPEIVAVKKGTLLEIRYPENEKDVFFRYVTDLNLIPSFFTGEIVILLFNLV